MGVLQELTRPDVATVISGVAVVGLAIASAVSGDYDAARLGLKTPFNEEEFPYRISVGRNRIIGDSIRPGILTLYTKEKPKILMLEEGRTLLEATNVLCPPSMNRQVGATWAGSHNARDVVRALKGLNCEPFFKGVVMQSESISVVETSLTK